MQEPELVADATLAATTSAPPTRADQLPSSRNQTEEGVRKIRIVIVDDHELMRSALKDLIDDNAQFEVCGEADDVDKALTLLREQSPDLMLIDISLKQGDGIDLIKRIRERNPEVRTVVLSMYDSKLYAERALRAGAVGYVNKQQPGTEVLEAIRTVMSGEVYLDEDMTREVLRRSTRTGESPARSPIETLSDRELEIFRFIGQGMATRQIAKELHLSTSTVETYRERLKTKLNARSGADLTRRAIQWVLENG